LIKGCLAVEHTRLTRSKLLRSLLLAKLQMCYVLFLQLPFAQRHALPTPSHLDTPTSAKSEKVPKNNNSM